MNDLSSAGSNIQRGWITETRTSQGWKEQTLKYYAEINLPELSNAASLVRDIKDALLQICALSTMRRF